MWNFKNILNENPPMTEILKDCSDKSNLRLVIYHLNENHVECAAERNGRQYQLDPSVTDEIAENARAPHAILAYDITTKDVYLIDSAPELNACSAILLCVLTEIMNAPCTCGKCGNASRVAEFDIRNPRTCRSDERITESADAANTRGFDFEPTVGYQPMIGIGNLGMGL